MNRDLRVAVPSPTLAASVGGVSPTLPRRLRQLASRPEPAFIVLLIGALLHRFQLMSPGAAGPLFLSIVKRDSGIFAAVFVLYSLAAVLKSGAGLSRAILARLCLCLCLAVIFIYVFDVFVYHYFNTRLYVHDVVTFSSDLHMVGLWSNSGSKAVLHSNPLKLLALLGAALILARASVHLMTKPLLGSHHPRWLLPLTALPLATYIFPASPYFYCPNDKPLYENVVERNKDCFVRQGFSVAFRAELEAAAPIPPIVKPGRHKRVNVIVVMIESLSAFHSDFFSGVENWTPRLDEIARRETALTNFHANGWTTIGGLVSLLGRQFPIPPEQAKWNFAGSPRLNDYPKLSRALPQTVARLGYQTEFIGAGDLDCLGQREWLKEVGFQRIVGGEDPRFKALKVLGPFGAVPDRKAYEIGLKEIEQLNAHAPFLVVIQTFWSHRPFLALDGSAVDGEAPVRRECDAALGTFYDRLAAGGFFENGLLFITGDHRTAMPYRSEEFDRFGASAITRIPAVIATRAIRLPKTIDQDFQQRDLAASIESLVGDFYSLAPHEGTFLAETATPPDCIIHARGDDRDLVYVKRGMQEGVIRIAGDKTSLVSGTLDDEASVVRTINLTRMDPSN
jgi:lipoteichoic acid synthase